MNSEINLSIRLTECSAKCAFCYYKDQEPEPYAVGSYLMQLRHAIQAIVPSLDRVVSLGITGGEPTESVKCKDVLYEAMLGKSNFVRTVFATNGIHLNKFLEQIGKSCTHVNVSRHHWQDDRNQAIFGVDVPSTPTLKKYCEVLNKDGVEVALSCVTSIGGHEPTRFIPTMIEYCKFIGASRLILRRPAGDMDTKWDYREEFKRHKAIYHHNCSACMSETALIHGVPVTFKQSAPDPGQRVDFEELIFQPNGKLTWDWEGNQPYDGSTDSFSPGMYSSPPPKSEGVPMGVCGCDTPSRGCGS